MRVRVLTVVIAAACMTAGDRAEAGWLWGKHKNNCDQHCECEPVECCECERKKRDKKHHCCLFQCFKCSEPPRAETVVSMPMRIERDAFREAVNRENDAQEYAESTENRIDVLERDLTRLTLAVEKVAVAQQQQQEDLTKATLILERLAREVAR